MTVGCCGGEKAIIVPPDKGAQTGETVHKGSHEFLGCIYIRLFITPHPVWAVFIYAAHVCCESVLPLLALTELKNLLKEERAASNHLWANTWLDGHFNVCTDSKCPVLQSLS